MKIIVTGGSGFVGTNICLYLKKVNPSYEIISFDNLRRRGSELNLSSLYDAGVKFIHGDIRNRYDFDSLGGYDLLIDASAEPSALAGINSDPGALIEHNLTGTVNCLTDCTKKNARFIFLSTSRVYPFTPLNALPFVETDTRYTWAKEMDTHGISNDGIDERFDLKGARTFYGATKLSAELLISEYQEFSGIQCQAFRFGLIAGPRQMGKSEQGLLSFWMASHFWNKTLKYIGFNGKGKQVRDVLHVDDVCDLINQTVHTNQTTLPVMNVGGGLQNSISLIELTQLCEEITGNKVSIASELETRPGDVRIYITNNKGITNHTGWTPKYAVRDTLTDIYEWIRSNESVLKPILT